jgi:hypothetical protein
MFNGTEQFDYLTAQIAHYFAPNLKGFIEYTVDVNRSGGGGAVNMGTGNPELAAILPMGNRLTAQIEVGF